MKNCCRVCGKAVGQKDHRALFTAVGVRDRIAERLSLVSGLSVCKDDLSEFACKKCVSMLDKFSHVQTEMQKLKTELTNELMKTTLRHRMTLRWKGGGAQQENRGVVASCAAAVITGGSQGFTPPTSTEVVGEPEDRPLQVPLPRVVTPHGQSKRRAPLTPASANKP